MKRVLMMIIEVDADEGYSFIDEMVNDILPSHRDYLRLALHGDSVKIDRMGVQNISAGWRRPEKINVGWIHFNAEREGAKLRPILEQIRKSYRPDGAD